MLQHYLTTAIVHFRRYKVTTLINVVCLAIGLVCFIAAHWMVTSMRNSDRHFPGADRTYVVTQKIRMSGAELSIPDMPLTAWPAGPRIREENPELETVARSSLGQEVPVKAGATKAFVKARYVDPEFLDVFRLRFIHGDGKAALRGNRTAVLTEPTAVRLFGSAEKAMGNRLLLQSRHDVLITGIIEPVAAPSHMAATETSSEMQFEALVSRDVYEDNGRDNIVIESTLRQWNIPLTLTYVVLPRDGSLTAEMLANRLSTFGARHVPPKDGTGEFGVVPLPGLGLSFLNILVGAEKTGLSSTMVIYILAALVLLISCLNYANLATAQAAARAKEVGMRRIVGARRGQVFVQHLVEAGLQSLISLLIAATLIVLLLGTQRGDGTSFIVSTILGSATFWSFLLLLWLGVTLVAGAYPAAVLSRIPPVQAVRGSRASTGGGRAPALLVGAQFGTASFLVIAILVMQNQNEELTQAALGAMTDPVVVLPNQPDTAGVSFDALRSELLTQPHVESVTGSVTPPWSRSTSLARVSTSADMSSRRLTVCYNMVNYDFFATLGFKLLAGRVFDRSFANDIQADLNTSPVRVSSVVIDRALAAQLGWSRPQDAIGKALHGWTVGDLSVSPAPLEIIGVVENRPLALIGVGASSNIYTLTPAGAFIPSVRVSRADVPAALKEIDAVWERLAPNVPLKKRFADEIWNEAYQPFKQVLGAFTLVAVLAFINAILGLIGMSLHVISRRTHEIGVRKTLGASGPRIFAMLLLHSSRAPLIANVIVWPLAFVAAQGYLSLFTTRMSLSLAPFVAGLMMTLLVSWAAVAFQAIRAASLKPANVLRYE